MKNSRSWHSVPRRITAVTAVRSKIKRDLLGWLFKCYTCWAENTFMVSEYDKAVALTRTHICRRKYGD
jgi:hypothetical protein